MAQIQLLTLPEVAGQFNDIAVSLDERMMAAMSQLITDNQHLRASGIEAMNKAVVTNSPGEMLKSLSLLGDHKIHTETLLAFAREVNRGIETLVKA
ncbi:hypothetical protein [Pantoea cypripedii]|uniref:Uncharacterized protein n=1 Tax=Pantoea cypripedii TaxID=55209 RepID=A0A6B9G8P8_PANCY|nr:hypothetical protein [Pantoea cypripedii]QGY32203.1 hypothetical protein CUN67_24735 [Pantoea cypripedii]